MVNECKNLKRISDSLVVDLLSSENTDFYSLSNTLNLLNEIRETSAFKCQRKKQKIIKL